MRKDRIAEWLLESVTTHERAASTVGDLMESAATRGDGWFWSSVLRTVASLMWRGVAADPRGMLGLAFRGWLLATVSQIALVLLLLFGLFEIGVRMLVSNGSTGLGAIAGGVTTVMIGIIAFGSMFLVQYWVGRWVARRAPNREMSACLALTILQVILALAIAVALRQSIPASLLSSIAIIPCFFGALSVRRHATR